MPKILIVDDEEPIRQILGDFMECAGFTYSALENGNEANSILCREKHDVLLTDIHMPGINGIDVIKQARADNPDLIIIALTSGINESFSYSDDATIKAGADKCIFKPFSGLTVIKSINKLLTQHKLISTKLPEVNL